jgi:hypothetical protein
MDSAIFDEMQQTLQSRGPTAAIDQLCSQLRARQDYGNLFYALLLKKRNELGVSPFPTGPGQDLPAAVQEEYENAIREAGREVGRLYLEHRDIPRAWTYFRMLGEPGPVAEALEMVQLGEDEDIQAVVNIAFYQGVNPRRGFNLILERYGICNAITTAGNIEFLPPEVRVFCIQRLVRALYDELRERIIGDIVAREGKPPEATTVRELIAGRDWLFEEGFAHVDVSHLSSVVQMSLQLSPGEELNLARELCLYGEKLPATFQYSNPPFEDQYRDCGIYLALLAGDEVEEGIAHFRAKADKADAETVGTFPAEVLVNLLLRLDRPQEALAVARQRLAVTDDRPLSCPTAAELCQRIEDYRTLAEVARENGDPVQFMAGLLAAKK